MRDIVKLTTFGEFTEQTAERAEYLRPKSVHFGFE